MAEVGKTNRRLAAVLIADVAGYTRLVEQDTDGTVAAWSAARADVIEPAIDSHGGRIVKLTGDGFLAEFPTVQDAVKCAVSMQSDLASNPLNFRMGVNLGDIVDDGQDIHGEGVNIAARIEALAGEGGICVSGMVYESVRNRLDYAFEDLGAHEVKHVSAPVHVFRVAWDTDANAQSDDKALPAKPSVAVLPFDNMSGDAEQEYFSDGITEDIIAALSRVRQFFVIARNSTFAYKGQSADIRRVASELGVRYVLEGSVRKASNRIRLTAQLPDGPSGNHLWAERYDRDLDDIFDLQDELTQTIVGAIEPELNKAEQARARLKKPENLGVWDIYQRGMSELHKLTAESLPKAEAAFSRAAEMDPNFAPAYTGLANLQYYSLVLGHAHDPDAARRKALVAGRKAVEVDREDADAHCAVGRAYISNRMFDDAMAELRHAIDLNPSDALAHYSLGAAQVFRGQPEPSLPHLDDAIRLSPHDANMGSFLVRKAQAMLYLRRHEEAADWARRALLLPNFQWSRYAVLASALGHLGRQEEAASALNELLQRIPDFSEQYALDYSPWLDDDHFKHLFDGLRIAGLSV